MDGLRRLCSRLLGVWNGRARDAAMTEEMSAHLDRLTAANRAAGMAPGDARHQALRQFGNVASIQEYARDEQHVRWLHNVIRDLRLGARMLRKNRLVTAAAIVSLSLALGACATAFSLVDALILRPLPVHQPERLIYLTFPSTNPDAARRRRVQRSGVRAPARRRTWAGRPVRHGVPQQAPRDIRRGEWRAGDGARAVRLR